MSEQPGKGHDLPYELTLKVLQVPALLNGQSLQDIYPVMGR